MNILVFLKYLFSISLLITFIWFFGIPSWNKFQAREVIINKRDITTDEIAPPALTICAENGWKSEDYAYDIEDYNLSLEYLDNMYSTIIIQNCGQTSNFEESLECIDGKTYSLGDLVPKAIEDKHSKDILNSSSWISDISYTQVGKCHTLNNSVPLDFSNWVFNLKNISYKIFVHDPDFHLISSNPAVIPSLWIQDINNFPMIYIEVIQHIKIHRPEQSCEERENYSFTACIKNSLSRKVGCR